MANKKITELDALASVATNDVVAIVDVSDTSQASSGSTKKVTISNLPFADTSSSQILSNKTLASPSFTGTVTMPTGLTGLAKMTAGVVSAVTAPSGAVVGDTDSQTLSAKTLTKPVVNGSVPAATAVNGTSGGTTTLDLSASNIHNITMPAGNTTIALSNVTTNQVFIISITQDSTGSRTVTWFTTIKWAGGSTPTLTTTANKRDTFGFITTGSGTYDGFVIGQNI